MNTADIIPFFQRSAPVLLPHTVPGGFVVQELNVECSSCERHTDEVRGEARDNAACTDFILAGVCRECRVVTQAALRIYGDGRILWKSNDGWIALESRPAGWSRISGAFRALKLW